MKAAQSRREEVYGGQFEWAIDKSERNVKAMSRQLDRDRDSSWVTSFGNCGKGRIWTQKTAPT